MTKTAPYVENFQPLHITYTCLRSAHDALKQIRGNVQTNPDCDESAEEFDTSLKSDIESLSRHSFAVLAGGPQDHLLHVFMGTAWKVIGKMNDHKRAFKKKEVQKLAEKEERLYDMNLNVAVKTMRKLSLPGESVKAALVHEKVLS